MSVGEAIDRVLSGVIVRESQWKFVTSGGASIGVSTPIARVGVNAGGGSMWVKKDGDADNLRLDYGGVGGSVGLSLVPTPVNFTFSIPAMPSAGRIYKLPFAGWTLTEDELKGGFVMIEVGADWGAGAGGALMFIGGSVTLATIVGFSTMGAGQLPALIATSEACVAFGGMTATVVPVNAGISIYVGIIL